MSKKTRNLIVFFAVMVAIAAFLEIFVLHHRVRDWGQTSPFDFLTLGYCTLRGGEMVTAGCGIAGCLGRCVIPYADGGRSCTGPGQCRGHCIVDMSDMPLPIPGSDLEKTALKGCLRLQGGNISCPDKKLTGTCEKRPAANCEFRWELIGTTLKPIPTDCAM